MALYEQSHSYCYLKYVSESIALSKIAVSIIAKFNLLSEKNNGTSTRINGMPINCGCNNRRSLIKNKRLEAIASSLFDFLILYPSKITPIFEIKTMTSLKFFSFNVN